MLIEEHEMRCLCIFHTFVIIIGVNVSESRHRVSSSRPQDKNIKCVFKHPAVIFLWIHNNVLTAPLLLRSYTTPKSNSRSVLGSNTLQDMTLHNIFRNTYMNSAV